MDSQFASRKFILTSVVMILMVILPIVYKKMDIANEITIIVEGALAAVGGIYNTMNVVQKKYEGQSAP